MTVAGFVIYSLYPATAGSKMNLLFFILFTEKREPLNEKKGWIPVTISNFRRLFKVN